MSSETPTSGPQEPQKPPCRHKTAALIVVAIAFLLLFQNRDGFRSQKQKDDIATTLVGKHEKPEFRSMKSIGLDGAESYEVRQLWNEGKFTKEGISQVL